MPGFLSDGRTVLPGSLASERRVGEGGARVRRAVCLCLCVRNYGNSHRMRNNTRACGTQESWLPMEGRFGFTMRAGPGQPGPTCRSGALGGALMNRTRENGESISAVGTARMKTGSLEETVRRPALLESRVCPET